MDYSFLLLSCTIHKSQYVAEKLRHLDGVNEATPVFGSYDCIVKTDKMTPDDVMQLVVSSNALLMLLVCFFSIPRLR